MRTIYLILTFVCCIIAKAETFPYRSIASFNISPASESHCMILDSEGMMWVGTNSGLKSYDGYTVKSYNRMLFLQVFFPTTTSVPWQKTTSRTSGWEPETAW